MEVIRDLHHPLSRPTAVALGFFDGVHRGHRAVIETAIHTAAASGLSACVFTFDTRSLTPRGKTGVTRLQSVEERLRCIADLGVDSVVCPDFAHFAHLSPAAFVEDILGHALQAKVVCCGQNYRFGLGAAAGTDELKALCAPMGIQVRISPVLALEGKPVSSSRIRRMVEEGEMETAARLLGRPFTLDAVVVPGRQLGRKLDFPTVNQFFPTGFTLPRKGVYATRALVEGRTYAAVTNVGVKPTVETAGQLAAETHIMGYTGDLYHQQVSIQFLRYLRPEQKFPTLEALRAQIQQDAKEAALWESSLPR